MKVTICLYSEQQYLHSEIQKRNAYPSYIKDERLTTGKAENIEIRDSQTHSSFEFY